MEAKIYNVSGWVKETSPNKLKNRYSELLGLSKFKILNFQEHYFEPEGYTALWLRRKSFCSTYFSRRTKKYIELSGCNA